MQEQLNQINKRLAKLEKLLTDALNQDKPIQKNRMTEKEVMREYDVSKTVLRRLRLGYIRSDGMRIEPKLFKWGHRNQRDFDYDREEIDAVLKRNVVTTIFQ